MQIVNPTDADNSSTETTLHVGWRANFIGASLSGLAVGYVLWRESLSSYQPRYRVVDYLQSTTIAVACYLAAALLVRWLGRKGWVSRIPRWVLVALAGSIMIAIYSVVMHYLMILLHPELWEFRRGEAVGRIIVEELKPLIGFFLIFTPFYTLFALPIMGVNHYLHKMYSSFAR